MTTVAIEQAQTNLVQLIESVARGEQVVITRNQVPVAELVPVFSASGKSKIKPGFGGAKGLISMSDDFDAPITDFKDYSE
jgi:prevent-host-death family protein